MTTGMDEGTSASPALRNSMARVERLSVLVAEAEPTLSQRTVDLLRESGVTKVSSVADGAAALAALEAQMFDLFLCAARLGGTPGAELVRNAKRVSPATRSVLMVAEDEALESAVRPLETLLRPFSRGKLGALLESVAAPSGGLWCQVPQLSLSDILQLYHQSRRSIMVLLSGPIAGRIRLEGGDIVDAEAGELRGLDALSRLLEAEAGLIRTEPPAEPTAVTIEGPFEAVILQAAQRLDERRRDSRLPEPRELAQTPTTHTAVPVPLPPPPRVPEFPSMDGEPRELVSTAEPEESAASNAPPSPGASGTRFDERPAFEPTFFETPPGGGGSRPSLGPLGMFEGAPASAMPHVEAREEDLAGQLRPKRRGRVLITAASLAAIAALAFATTLALRSREREVVTAPPERTEALSLRPAAAPATPDPRTAEAARAGSEASLEPRHPASTPARDDAPAGDAPAGERAAAGVAPTPTSAQAERESFTLTIHSKPPRAKVSEKGKYLGRTPLEVTIERSLVASEPREFLVYQSGHFARRVIQADSAEDVRTTVRLKPKPNGEAGEGTEEDPGAASGAVDKSAPKRLPPGARESL